MKIKKKLMKILDHYGHVFQSQKLEEEISELSAEISNRKPVNITSECADVFIMLYQFYLVDKALQREVTYKIKRQLKRMKCEHVNKMVDKIV